MYPRLRTVNALDARVEGEIGARWERDRGRDIVHGGVLGGAIGSPVVEIEDLWGL